MSMENVAYSAMWNAMTAPDGTPGQPFRPGTVKRVLAMARERRGLLTLFVLGSVVLAVLAVATPVLAGNAVDAVGTGDRTRVTTLAALIAAVALAEAALGLVVRWWSARLGEDLILDLRTRV